jgi:hypothetical protein
MPVTTPPALSAIPAFPALSERAAGTYNANAYACLNHWATTGGPQLAALANNVADNATDAAGSASSAATARTAAEQAQAAAESASAASKWVSGTTYAEGFVAWSPADFGSYRRKSTGAGTIDPSADSANWAKLGASAALNGSQTLTTSTTLTASSPAVNLLAFTAHGGSVTMPNATTMTAGGCKFILDNSAGQFPVGVLNGAGQVMGQVLPGDSIQLHLTSAATAAGVWRHSGNFDPVWITNEIGLSLTRPTATANIFGIDATRCLVYWRRSGDSYPMGRVVTWTSPTATPTVSAELALRGASDSLSAALPIGASRALLRFSSGNMVLLDTSAPAVGAAVAVTFTAGGSNRVFQVLDGQYAVVAGIDESTTPRYLRARCLDCGTSGTTITVGAEAVSPSYTMASGSGWFGGGFGARLVSSTVVALMGQGSNSGYQSVFAYALTRTSGTTLSFSANAGEPPSLRTSDTTQNTNDLHPLSASTALYWYWSNTSVRYAVITFASGSATWGTSVASNVCTSTANATAFAASPDRTRFVAAQCVPSSTCNTEAITVSGATVTVGASTSFSAETAASSPAINTLAVTNEGRGLIFWTGQAFVSGGLDKIRLFTLSGTTFTFGSEASSVHQAGFGSEMTTSFNVSSWQQFAGNNLFSIRSSLSGTSPVSRIILFRVSGAAGMDVLAEFDTIGQVDPSVRSGNDALMVLSSEPSGGSLAERIVVNANTKRVIRARVPTRRLGSQMGNGQSDWSNLQRATGLGLLSHYVLPGSNALLQTHRIAEV